MQHEAVRMIYGPFAGETRKLIPVRWYLVPAQMADGRIVRGVYERDETGAEPVYVFRRWATDWVWHG